MSSTSFDLSYNTFAPFQRLPSSSNSFASSTSDLTLAGPLRHQLCIMVTIDYAAFPHIIDGIWAEMDVDTVLTAQAVCSEWRDRAHKRLRRRLELWDYPSVKSHVKLSSRDAPYPKSLVQVIPLAADAQQTCDNITGSAFKNPFRMMQTLDVDFSGVREHSFQAFTKLLSEMHSDALLRALIPGGNGAPYILGGGGTRVFFLGMGIPATVATPDASAVVINLDYWDELGRSLGPGPKPPAATEHTGLWDILSPKLARGCRVTCIFHLVSEEPSTGALYLCYWLCPRGLFIPPHQTIDAEVDLVGLEEYFEHESDYEALKTLIRNPFTDAGLGGDPYWIRRTRARLLARFVWSGPWDPGSDWSCAF